MNGFDEYIEKLKQALGDSDGLDSVIGELTKKILPSSASRKFIINLQARLADMQENQMARTLRREDLEITQNQLRLDTFNFIDTIKPFDIFSPTATEQEPVRKEIGKARIFISYASKDVSFKDELEMHLASLKRSQSITTWQESELHAGSILEDHVRKNINEADLILILVSADYINSQEIWEQELELAMNKSARSEVILIPIYIRPSDWEELKFSKIVGLPRNKVPISRWADRDEAWLSVVTELKKVIKHINS